MKTKRAKEHIGNFQAASARFLKENPSFVDAKHDPNTREVIYYIEECPSIPDELLLIAGDAIQNLRSSLDHLIWQLVDAYSGPPPENVAAGIEFPIGKDFSDYKSRVPRKVKGVHPDAQKVINDIEPYKGGKGNELWVLHNLNRIDKHRLLITAISAHHSMNIGIFMDGKIAQHFGKTSVKFPPIFGLISDAKNTGRPIFPLVTGTELFIDAPDSEVNKNMQFTYQIAFGEPGVAEGRPVIETLENMANLVENLISNFEPFLH